MKNSNAGKLVFLERINEKNEVDYYSGEYLCLTDTGNVLYCCKVGSCYQLQDSKAFNLIGTNKWNLISSKDAASVIQNLIVTITNELKEAEVKPHWISSVYSQAKRNLEILSHYINIKPEPKLRAWRPEEVPVGALVKTDTMLPTLILSVFKNRNQNLGYCFSFLQYSHYTDSQKTDYSFLTDAVTSTEHYQHSIDGGKTWHPCGVME